MIDLMKIVDTIILGPDIFDAKALAKITKEEHGKALQRAEAAEAKLAEAMKELKSIEEKSAQTAYGSDHTICYTCAENLEQVHKFLKENGNG